MPTEFVLRSARCRPPAVMSRTLSAVATVLMVSAFAICMQMIARIDNTAWIATNDEVLRSVLDVIVSMP